MAKKTLSKDNRAIEGTILVTWATLAANDEAAVLNTERFSDKTIHVKGTFGGTVSIEGSNDAKTWVTLTDPQGNALDFTAEGVKLIAEHPKFIRPNPKTGVSAADVILYGINSDIE